MVNAELIGRHIREARKKKGWTQQRLSDATGVTTSAISAYENGLKTPSLDTLDRFARALESTLDLLCYGNESEAFIERAGSSGRIVANCINELWSHHVLASFEDSTPYMRILCYEPQIRRLINSLDDFRDRERLLPDPKDYLEQLLESTARDIDEEALLDQFHLG